MADAVTGSPPPQLELSTQLALERTRIAYERTVMAWIRTATSLITFGFSVYKFFQLEMTGKSVPAALVGPRGFAVLLIGIGLLALLMGAVEYRRDLRVMRKHYPGMPTSGSGAVAALIAVLGLLALVAVIVRG